VRLGVGQVEGSAEHVANFAVQSGPCRGERYCAEVAPVESPFPGIDIAWVDDDPVQGSVQGLGTFQGQRLIDRIGARGGLEPGAGRTLLGFPDLTAQPLDVAFGLGPHDSPDEIWRVQVDVIAARIRARARPISMLEMLDEASCMWFTSPGAFYGMPAQVSPETRDPSQ